MAATEADIDEMYRNLDPLHPFNFRSRSERAQTMPYPPSTDKRLIIPSNKGGYGYNAKEVDVSKFPEINRLIINSTADQATKICEACFVQKKQEEVKDRHKLSYYALNIALCLCIAGFVVFMIPIYSPGYQSQNIIYLGFGCLGMAIFITLVIIIITLLMKRSRVSLEDTISTKLKAFIRDENIKVYNKLNLEVAIGYKFFWLEIKRMLC